MLRQVQRDFGCRYCLSRPLQLATGHRRIVVVLRESIKHYVVLGLEVLRIAFACGAPLGLKVESMVINEVPQMQHVCIAPFAPFCYLSWCPRSPGPQVPLSPGYTLHGAHVSHSARVRQYP